MGFLTAPAATGTPPSTRPRPPRGGLLPGLGLAVCGVAAAWLVHRALPAVPLLTAAVVLGITAAHLPRLRHALAGPGRPGLSFAARRLMRIGIVLLGLGLGLDDILGLGWETAVVVPVVVGATLLGTWWLGRRLGLPGDQPLLIGVGYAICGASAIGAVAESRDSDERDAATAVALVTLCGTLAITVLPLLQGPLGLGDAAFGRWVGASVHDVGQVVATARTAGADALDEAVMVKLMRVALLAPVVAAVALSVRRRATTPAGPGGTGAGRRRVPLVPLFVAGFLCAVAVRSSGLLPAAALGVADVARELLLAAALFALGSAVRLPVLARTGGRVALLGLCAWVVVAGLSYGGVVLLGG
ncbi:putative sulfate exporter family transporter [Streptomyces sp. NPDC005805]|uniref:YeiH family protein n=1 Tax=Streptomyces sp. NPDC005805 TaxID=3157068 RepID=UPI0033F35E8E